MRNFLENLFAVGALIGTEAWFLNGYFHGAPDFEPAIAFVAALGVLLAKDPVRAHFAKKGLPADHDSRLYDDFLSLLPFEPAIRLLRDQDFQAPVHRASLQPLFDFAREWESVEKEFLNADLERERKALHTAAHDLVQEIARRTVPVRNEGFISVQSDRHRESADPWPPDVLEDARVLNRAATSFVAKHEAFVRECRRKLKT